jgi:stage V sporulation protein G
MLNLIKAFKQAIENDAKVENHELYDIMTITMIRGGKRMKITDVRVKLVESDSRLRGVATITFDDAFVVHDIRIIEGENGIFVAMPSKKTPNGTFRDIAHPIHGDMRKLIEEAIVQAYEDVKNNPPQE